MDCNLIDFDEVREETGELYEFTATPTRRHSQSETWKKKSPRPVARVMRIPLGR